MSGRTVAAADATVGGGARQARAAQAAPRSGSLHRRGAVAAAAAAVLAVVAVVFALHDGPSTSTPVPTSGSVPSGNAPAGHP